MAFYCENLEIVHYVDNRLHCTFIHTRIVYYSIYMQIDIIIQFCMLVILLCQIRRHGWQKSSHGDWRNSATCVCTDAVRGMDVLDWLEPSECRKSEQVHWSPSQRPRQHHPPSDGHTPRPSSSTENRYVVHNKYNWHMLMVRRLVISYSSSSNLIDILYRYSNMAEVTTVLLILPRSGCLQLYEI